MGIMLDGDSYRQSTNTKDREVAQMNVLSGLGWKRHRIWTLDWWDNKQKEIGKMLSLLEEKKQNAYETAKSKGMLVERSEEKKESIPGTIPVDKMEKQEPVTVQTEGRIEKNDGQKHVDFQEPKVEIQMTLSNQSKDYILKSNMTQITDRLQEIINTEAPISYDRLLKKTLRTFGIARTSEQTIEATEKALKKVTAKTNKQNGAKFYWREDQNIDSYGVYRNDTELIEKRSLDDICQQELKNAVCFTLKEKGPLTKEELLKETIRSMGYGRSGAALVDAVERGLKYGRKTGEVGLDADKRFVLMD